MATLASRKITSGLSRPVFVTAPPGDFERLFIVEQHRGRIKILKLGSGQINPTPFLTIGGLPTGNEQGLLGLAFHPDYARNGQFYVNLTLPGGAAGKGVTHVRRYQVSADPDVADPGSLKTVLTFDQPETNHNGGWLAFGPRDGFLYVATGDGGGGNDPDNRAQNLGDLLGKMLRIDVNGDDFPGDSDRSYAIPPGNPFVGRAGARPEIWAFGLRNPWRNSFDRQTGDLYIADVGQSEREEINVQPAASEGGENYGWRLKEGTRVTGLDPVGSLPLVEPIHEYGHDKGSAIIGGYVYRGKKIPDLQGTYFFADFTGDPPPPPIWSFRFNGSPVADPTERTTELAPAGGSFVSISSFGEDAAGELYIVDVFGGAVHQIVASA